MCNQVRHARRKGKGGVGEAKGGTSEAEGDNQFTTKIAHLRLVHLFNVALHPCWHVYTARLLLALMSTGWQ